MDRSIVVTAPTCFAIAAEEDADQPPVPASTDDLSETTRNISSEVGTQTAHKKCTSHNKINFLGEEMGEGQSVNPSAFELQSHALKRYKRSWQFD